MKAFILFTSLVCLLCAEETLPQIEREKFNDVLLIVNYNHPYYDSIPYIKSLYSPLFPNIVFYGEKPQAEIQTADIYFGVYWIRVVEDVLKRFPNYRGYLFLQDDCMMNVWNLSKLDKDKFWLAVDRFPSNENELPESWSPEFDKTKSHEGFLHASYDGLYREHWGWWVPHIYGIAAVEKAMPLVKDSYLNQLQLNVGKNVAIALPCDMFYIPGKFKEDALALSRTFTHIFYEISIPMMFACIEPMTNWEILKMFWGFTQEHFLDYRTDVDWLHPLKFSKLEYREFAYKKLHDYYKTLPE